MKFPTLLSGAKFFNVAIARIMKNNSSPKDTGRQSDILVAILLQALAKQRKGVIVRTYV